MLSLIFLNQDLIVTQNQFTDPFMQMTLKNVVDKELKVFYFSRTSHASDKQSRRKKFLACRVLEKGVRMVRVGRSVTLIVAMLTLTQFKVTVGDVTSAAPVQDNDVVSPQEYEVANHPHNSRSKPTKLDLDLTKMTMTDNKILHQQEAEKLNATELRCTRNFSTKCIKRKLVNIMDEVSKSDLDTYNVTDSIQIVRNPSRRKSVALSRVDPDKLTLFERVKRFANNYALKIKLPTDLLTSRKARTFFGGEYLELTLE